MADNEIKELKEQLDRVEKALLGSKNVLTMDEASQYAGISKSHLYKLTSTQKIPHYKPRGKEIYFKKEELDEWLLQNRVSTTEEIDRQATTYVAINK